jgi:hypothetical protein
MLKTTQLLNTAIRTKPVGRFYSSIPFDKKTFPFSRFEPCCPDVETKQAENGFIPCQSHPMPAVLGKKIELTEEMTRPSSLRHILACIGPEALEWTRSKVESVQGIMQTLMNTENAWLKSHRPSLKDSDRLVLTTVAERPPSDKNGLPDIMLFPEFKLMPSVDPSAPIEKTPLYDILDTIWQNPNTPLKQADELQDIEADTVVLVCTHARRDMRCGRLGPLIVDEFHRIIKEKGLTKKVEVWGTSHFGGKL